MIVTSSTLANSIDFAPRQASVLRTVHPFPSSYASVPIPGERWVSQEVARDDRKCPWYVFSDECHGVPVSIHIRYGGQ